MRILVLQGMRLGKRIRKTVADNTATDRSIVSIDNPLPTILIRSGRRTLPSFNLAELAVRRLRHRCLRLTHLGLAREHIHDHGIRARRAGAVHMPPPAKTALRRTISIGDCNTG